jgi:formate transporter
VTDIDALLPAQMARRAEDIGVAKASLPLDRLFILAVLGGVFISLGAAFSTVVTAGGGLAPGVSRLLGGLTFALGLILVVVGGAELFTGNMLVVMAAASGRIRLGALARNWAVVYIGNLIGAVATAVLVFLSQQYRQGSGSVGERVLAIAQTKSSLGVLPAVTLGVLANLLVCLAVWLSLSARSTVDRVVAVTVPVAAFVACGFEHSIANMYFLPIGLFVKDHAPDAFWTEIAGTKAQFAELTWTRAITHNLLPVTAGNIIGGGLLVAATYWFVYLRRPTVVVPIAPDGSA